MKTITFDENKYRLVPIEATEQMVKVGIDAFSQHINPTDVREIWSTMLNFAPDSKLEPFEQFLADHLRLWKDSGIPAPRNELQSIDAWLQTCAEVKSLEELKNHLRARKHLLLETVFTVHDLGPEVEDKIGIYDDAPELRPED